MNHDQAKKAVQEKYFGYSDEKMCLFVFVGRIVEQKGVYLIIDSFEELNRQFNGKLMFIVGGQAAPDDRSYGLPCTQKMWDLKNRYPKQFWADPSQFFSDGLLCCQAADYTMIPSLFEPSGIVQQEAFASGCPVIAFRTGGLADTVFEFDREKLTGNGFVFLAHHHYDFILAVQRAVAIFEDKKLYPILRQNAFKSTLSTEKVAIAWSREFARLSMKIFERKEHPPIEQTTAKFADQPKIRFDKPKPIVPPASLAIDVKKLIGQSNQSTATPQVSQATSASNPPSQQHQTTTTTVTTTTAIKQSTVTQSTSYPNQSNSSSQQTTQPTTATTASYSTTQQQATKPQTTGFTSTHTYSSSTSASHPTTTTTTHPTTTATTASHQTTATTASYSTTQQQATKTQTTGFSSTHTYSSSSASHPTTTTAATTHSTTTSQPTTKSVTSTQPTTTVTKPPPSKPEVESTSSASEASSASSSGYSSAAASATSSTASFNRPSPLAAQSTTQTSSSNKSTTAAASSNASTTTTTRSSTTSHSSSTTANRQTTTSTTTSTTANSKMPPQSSKK